MPRMKEVEGQVGAERFAAEKAKVQRLICPRCDERVARKQVYRLEQRLRQVSKKQRKEPASGAAQPSLPGTNDRSPATPPALIQQLVSRSDTKTAQGPAACPAADEFFKYLSAAGKDAVGERLI